MGGKRTLDVSAWRWKSIAESLVERPCGVCPTTKLIRSSHRACPTREHEDPIAAVTDHDFSALLLTTGIEAFRLSTTIGNLQLLKASALETPPS
jgi:hypothetical protein